MFAADKTIGAAGWVGYSHVRNLLHAELASQYEVRAFQGPIFCYEYPFPVGTRSCMYSLLNGIGGTIMFMLVVKKKLYESNVIHVGMRNMNIDACRKRTRMGHGEPEIRKMDTK